MLQILHLTVASFTGRTSPHLAAVSPPDLPFGLTGTLTPTPLFSRYAKKPLTALQRYHGVAWDERGILWQQLRGQQLRRSERRCRRGGGAADRGDQYTSLLGL